MRARTADRLARRALLWLCDDPLAHRRREGAVRRRARRGSAALAARGADPPLRRLDRRAGDARHAAGRTIALAGHLDVVRTEHDGPPRIEGDRLYGAGRGRHEVRPRADARRSRSDSQSPRPLDLTLVFYAREEGPYAENELGPVLEHDAELARELDLAVCLEPSDNKLQLGCGGSLHATVQLSRAHRAQRAPLAGRERDPQERGRCCAPERARARRPTSATAWSGRT